MIKHEARACACVCACVCVCVCVGVCGCVHVSAVTVCRESMNDVTDNAKNNFGDPLDAKYIACARSVSENIPFFQ